MPFTEYDFLQQYRDSFRQSELGRIHRQLPLKELAETMALKMPRANPQGRKPLFPAEGELALMFLKPYTGLSDDGLVEMLNGSIHMQLFCGVLIDPASPIKDGKIVSAIRNRLGALLDIEALQKTLYGHWKSGLTDTDMLLTDATCYESHLRFPTDVKLLWECCEWLYGLLVEKSRLFGEKVPRTKYRDIEKARLVHAKQRKPKKSETRKIRRRLIHLLDRIVRGWTRLNRITGGIIVLTAEQHKRVTACLQVLRQQSTLMNGGTVEGRIVSIDRPYIRPIVRGKENRRVEFGAKVNSIQIDGISFIEHLSFEAFNEGIRLKECISYHKELTGEEPKRIGADTIYATNANRKMCSGKKITTCFARKGPKPREEDAELSSARRIIGNLRATVMEGSFGNQKLHYGLGRISARNMRSEILQIFFGIHMANAAIMAARQLAKEEESRRKLRSA